MGVRVVTPPASLPVSIDEQRDFMRVDGIDDDQVIFGLIAAATEQAENYLRRSLVTRTLRCFLDTFPLYGATVAPAAGIVEEFSTQHVDHFTHNLIEIQDPPYSLVNGQYIRLPYPPVVSVATLRYIDADGVTVTMPAGDYVIVDAGNDETLIGPKYGTAWPSARLIRSAVFVDYDAGYGKPGDVPQSIRTWIQRRAADIYENRENREDAKGYALLNRYRITFLA